MILLNESRAEIGKVMPESMSLTLEERGGSMTLELPPDAPDISLRYWMIDDGVPDGTAWRVKSMESTFQTRGRSVSLEHAINTLKDTVLFGTHTASDMSGGSDVVDAGRAIEYVLEHQSMWQLGRCDYTDVLEEFEFTGTTLFEAIETVCTVCEDAEWKYDFSTFPFTLNVVHRETDTGAEMRMSRNISTIRWSIDRSGMYTRLFPIGEDDLHITGNYVSANENLWGVICKIETESSIGTEAKLRQWALQRLQKHCNPVVSGTITGFDLSAATGESLDHIRVGKVCRCPLPEHGTVILERIVKMQWRDRIGKPEEVTVTLSNAVADLASIIKNSTESSTVSGSKGAKSAKKAGEDHAWFVDTESHVAMVAEAVAGPGASRDWSRVSEIYAGGEGIYSRVVRAEGEIVTAYSLIEQTESYLRATIADTANGLSSRIEQTASQIRAEVSDTANGLSSRITQTASEIRAEVSDTANGLSSRITQTASEIRAEVNDTANGLSSRITQTASSILQEVSDTANGLSSRIEQTASSILQEVSDTANGLSSRITQTASSILQEVSDTANGLSSRIEETASYIRAEVSDTANGLSSRIEQTASSILQEVSDTANGLSSRIEETASYIRAEVSDTANGLSSRIEQTASSILQEVSDTANGLSSRIEQTASSWEAKISGVTDSNGNVTAASIGVAINANGSNAFISADHVKITGDTLLSGHITVENGALKVLTALSIGNTTGSIVTINNGYVNAPHLQVNSGGSLVLVGAAAGEHYDLTASNIQNFIKKADISGNTLRLWKFTDADATPSITFSKATTLRKAWSSGGTLTVTASQTNNGTTTTVGTFVSAHAIVLNGNGMSNFSAEVHTQDTGEAALTKRLDKYIYLYENVNGLSSTVVAGENSDGTSPVASISTRATYNAGVTQGEINGAAAYKTKVRSRFNVNNGSYYIEAYESDTGNGITNASVTYKLGTSGSTSSTVVQIQNSSGTKIADTPELSVGSLYSAGQNNVTITKGNWSSGTISFMKSTGTASTKQVRIGGTWSQNGATGTFTVKDYLDVSDTTNGVAVGYTTSVTVSNVDGNNNKVVVKNGSATVAELTHGKYNAGWAAGLSTLSSTATASGTLSYDGTATVTVKYTDAAGTEHTYLSRTYTAPSDRYTTGWGDCYATRVFTASADSKTLSYGESVTVSASLKNSSGTVVSMGSRTYVAPSDRYSTGWDDCYATRVFTASAASKTLGYDESVTVSASLKNSSGTVVSMGSRTYVAPSDRYDEGWYDGWNDYCSAKYHAGDWSPATTYGHTWQSTGTGGTTAGKHYVTIPGPYNSSNVYQGWKPLLCVEDEATYLGWSSTSGGGSVNNINLHDPTVTEDGSLVSRMTALSTLSSLINSSVGHRKYVYFTVTASDSNGGSLDKLYYVSIN